MNAAVRGGEVRRWSAKPQQVSNRPVNTPQPVWRTPKPAARIRRRLLDPVGVRACQIRGRASQQTPLAPGPSPAGRRDERRKGAITGRSRGLPAFANRCRIRVACRFPEESDPSQPRQNCVSEASGPGCAASGFRIRHLRLAVRAHKISFGGTVKGGHHELFAST
jgi:hypothetical protein